LFLLISATAASNGIHYKSANLDVSGESIAKELMAVL